MIDNKIKGEEFENLVLYINQFIKPYISDFLNYDMISYDSTKYVNDIIIMNIVLKNHYKTKSLTFLNSDKIKNIFKLKGIDDIEISNSGNLMMFFNYKEIKEHIQSNEILNLFRTNKIINKFNI